MAHCTDSFGKSWLHMVHLLFQPFRLEYWLKGALLVFFAQGYQGPKPNPTKWFQEHMQSGDIYAVLLQNLPLIIAGVLLLLVLGTIFMFFGACVHFLLLDGVKQGVFHLRKSFTNNLPGIISLFLWNLIAGIILIGFGLLIAAVVMAPFFLVMGSNPNTVLMVLLVLVFMVLGLGFFVAIIIYFSMLAGLVVPQMLVEKKGIFEAWSKAISIVMGNLMEFVGYIVIQTGIGLVFGFIVFIFYMLFSMFALAIVASMGGMESFPETMTAMQDYGLLMPLGAFVALFLLPVPILLHSYTLHFVAALTGNGSYYPDGSQAASSPPPASPSSGPVPDAPPTPPTPASGNPAPQPPMNGPVNFADIPIQAANSAVQSDAPAPPEVDESTIEAPRQTDDIEQPIEDNDRKE